MNNKPILYNYFRSSCSWRVRIVMELKQIEYAYVSVNLLTGEQFTDSFSSINPKQEVPALKLNDDLILFQSLPIIEFIDETFNGNGIKLLPSDPIKRAWTRQIAEIINSGIQPYQNANVLKRLIQMTSSEEKKTEWLQYYLSKGLNALEETLRKTSGKYCVGDEITLADVCLVPQVYGAKRFSIDLTPYPNIVRINAELEKLPAFIKAHAHRQIDTPNELRETN